MLISRWIIKFYYVLLWWHTVQTSAFFSGFLPTKSITHTHTHIHRPYFFLFTYLFILSCNHFNIIQNVFLEGLFKVVFVLCMIIFFEYYLNSIAPISTTSTISLPTQRVHSENISMILQARSSIHLHLPNTLWSYPQKKKKELSFPHFNKIILSFAHH